MTDVNDVAEPTDEPTDLPEVQEDTANAPEAPEEGEEAVEEQPRPKKTAQERINELTAKQRQAERDAEYWREQALRAQTPQTPAPAPQPQEGEPDPSQYQYGETDAAFIRDMARYEARREFEALQTQQREREAQQSFQERLQGFSAKITADDEGAYRLLGDRTAPVTVEMAETLFSMEAGVKVADFLGRNYAEARRIASLPAHLQGMELARLEHRIAVTPKPTGAPQPAPTLRGTGGKFAPAPDTNDFAAFEKLADGMLSRK